MPKPPIARDLVRRLFPLAALAALVSTGCGVTHPRGVHGPACKDIESASHIVDHPIQRFRIYKQIAARPQLSQHEQTYLVNAIFPAYAGGFGSDQAAASIILTRNRCCTELTREQIRARLKHVKIVGTDERHILAALDAADSLDKTGKPAESQPRTGTERPQNAAPRGP